MIKRIVFVIVILVVLTGILAGIKSLQIKRMISMGQHVTQPPEIVTVVSVQPAVWETVLTSVGSLGSVQGVVVSAELIGVQPSDCEVFEDGQLGLEAAERAGMMSVDVTQYYEVTIGREINNG